MVPIDAGFCTFNFILSCHSHFFPAHSDLASVRSREHTTLYSYWWEKSAAQAGLQAQVGVKPGISPGNESMNH